MSFVKKGAVKPTGRHPCLADYWESLDQCHRPESACGLMPLAHTKYVSLQSLAHDQDFQVRL